jgi:hypothetical protein
MIYTKGDDQKKIMSCFLGLTPVGSRQSARMTQFFGQSHCIHSVALFFQEDVMIIC